MALESGSRPPSLQLVGNINERICGAAAGIRTKAKEMSEQSEVKRIPVVEHDSPYDDPKTSLGTVLRLEFAIYRSIILVRHSECAEGVKKQSRRVFEGALRRLKGQ